MGEVPLYGRGGACRECRVHVPHVQGYLAHKNGVATLANLSGRPSSTTASMGGAYKASGREFIHTDLQGVRLCIFSQRFMWTPASASLVLSDYYEVDVLGVRCTFVNFELQIRQL